MAHKRSGTRWGLMMAAVLLAMAVSPAGAADAPLVLAQKAMKAGKPDLAVRAIDVALGGASLKGADVARAYLVRGLAYAKTGKKAAAIADLSHALWLKGLGDAERQEATAAKATLYQQAGLAAPTAEPVRPPEPVAEAAKPAPLPKTAAAAVAAPAADTPAWDTKIKADKAVARKKKSASEPTIVAQASGPGEGEPDSLPWAGSATASTAPVKASTSALVADSPVNSVLGSLFGATPVAAAPAAPPAAAPAVPEVVATAEANTPWHPDGKADTAPAAGKQPAKVKTLTAKGTIYLQLASLRSPAEADGLAARLGAEHADLLSGIEPRVKPVVLGNMGTFYSVRVGPVATAAAGNSLCAKLRGKGVDCFIASP